MVLSVASFKGGVAKTTTAIHLAAFLSESAPTLLVDEDPNQSSVDWAEAGQLPFRTVTHDQAAAAFPQYQHRVVDTGARLGQEGLTDLGEGSDFVVVPTTPDALALNALLKTVTPLRPSQERTIASSSPLFLRSRLGTLMRQGRHSGVSAYRCLRPRSLERWHFRRRH